jgi:hypothetical protein
MKWLLFWMVIVALGVSLPPLVSWPQAWTIESPPCLRVVGVLWRPSSRPCEVTP